MRTVYFFTSLIVLIFACGEHDQTTAILKGYQDQKEVVYQTSKADFYLGYDDLIDHCNREDNGEANDFTFAQIIDYIQSYPTEPILIPDTLGTKMAIASEVMFNDSDSLIRVRDQDHPYAYITEEIEWIIFSFAEKGKLKIFVKEANYFVDTVVVDKINTNQYGGIQIELTNGSSIFSRITWIR